MHRFINIAASLIFIIDLDKIEIRQGSQAVHERTQHGSFLRGTAGKLRPELFGKIQCNPLYTIFPLYSPRFLQSRTFRQGGTISLIRSHRSLDQCAYNGFRITFPGYRNSPGFRQQIHSPFILEE